MVKLPEVISVPVVQEHAEIGRGGLQGAQQNSRETLLWRPSMRSPDAVINGVKALADARGRDMAQNDGYTTGVVSLHRDAIVGSQYRLNAKPVLRVLRGINKSFDETWEEEFQEVVEARFHLLGESEACWLDASRTNTFTSMVRLAVAGWVMTGEVLATSEWEAREFARPVKTCFQMVSSVEPARGFGH
jgi:capsid protein